MAALAPHLKAVLGAHNIPIAPPSVLPHLVTAFEAVRDGKVTPTPGDPGQVIYKVEGFSFRVRASKGSE
ncbi:MAG TPA: hypothetical protein VK466_08675 [Terriglobales bacterium]|nr:hypothetical protein [Terriglobales bacterium]